MLLDYHTPFLRPLLDLISGEEFETEVNALGGYDTSDTGRWSRDSATHLGEIPLRLCYWLFWRCVLQPFIVHLLLLLKLLPILCVRL